VIEGSASEEGSTDRQFVKQFDVSVRTSLNHAICERQQTVRYDDPKLPSRLQIDQ
jgi:hypothetical protein